jgi:hypothetical protein
MKIWLRYWVLIVLAGTALGAAAWAGLTPVSAESREEVYVIPQGTWARRSAGEKFDVLPSEIHLTIGVKDVLVMKNQDDVPQMFGPVLIMPGQSFRLPFNVASRYDFACTAHVSGQLTVFVQPMPVWWKLVQWRAAAIMSSGRWL